MRLDNLREFFFQAAIFRWGEAHQASGCPSDSLSMIMDQGEKLSGAGVWQPKQGF